MAGRISPFLVVIVVALTACGGGENRDPDELALPAELDEAIDSAYARFSTAYERGDAGLVAGLYAPDALYLPPEGDVLRGRPAIRASFESFFEAAAQQEVEPRIGFTSVERRGSGALAYDVGYYTLEFANAGRTFATSRGKFTTVWTPGADGRWRIQVDAFNPAEPPEQPGDTLGIGADTVGGPGGQGGAGAGDPPARRGGGAGPP